MQVASIGDVSNCTFLSNAAGTDGPAVYAFNCAGRIFNNAFANEPVNAVRGLQSSCVVCSLMLVSQMLRCLLDAAMYQWWYSSKTSSLYDCLTLAICLLCQSLQRLHTNPTTSFTRQSSLHQPLP